MPRELRLLSFNIQAGASTRRYREYFTRSYAHVLPTRKTTTGNLDQIAGVAGGFDIVGLQEADPGSLRSSFLNQTHYLAEKAGFDFWSHQPNRRVARIAGSANGLLSRYQPEDVIDYALPSRIPGRGALWVRYGEELDGLVVVVAHLSLGLTARIGQITFLTELLADCRRVVLMGDFNCEPRAPEMEPLYHRTRLRPPEHSIATFPSWEPRWAIDGILASRSVRVAERWRVNEPLSDHLAVAARIELDGAR
ncbi:MAG TPA: endonuclease/exonuclease/phosphatase family protein [Xanthomonadaceae bacterium]|nr:endonuclease/exonuclease/phosphatase family protein [Xanthomonadaceae bacterium]